MSDNLIFNDVNVNFKLDASSDQAIFTKTQEIPDAFLRDLHDQRIASSGHERMGDFALAASIPTSVVEQWMTEGFNIYDQNNKLEDIMKRLRKMDMDNLIATNKRLY